MLHIEPHARDGFPPSGPLLIVSPHLDDAALSCAALLGRGEPVDVLTVFAGAPEPPRAGWWDVRCGFASSAESMPARRLEDERALKPEGHELRYLDLLELQHLDGPRGAGDAEWIVRAVADWLSGRRGAVVAVPAGAGWAPSPSWLPRRLAQKLREPQGPDPHDDHVFTRDGLVASPLEATLLLYEEVPYLWGGPADQAVQRTAAAHGYGAHLHTVTVDKEEKARRVAAYASQVPHISPPAGRVDSPGVLPERERYWVLHRR